MPRKRKIIFIMTVLNLIILVCLVVCVIRISKLNQSINSVTTEFDYTENTNGTVSLSLGSHENVTMRFNKNGVSIKESYLYDNELYLPKVLCFVRYYADKKGYEVPRSNTELIGEYRLHTILYSVGYEPEHTKTLDWEFDEDPRWYVNTVSSILGWCGI